MVPSIRRPLLVTLLAMVATGSVTARAGDYNLFAHTNLVAWCIVPFDATKRGPEERAAMLEQLGFTMFAYDYRAEHIPQWNDEITALQKHHVRLVAWWFPTELNDEARKTLALFRASHLHPDLWVMGGGAPVKSRDEQATRVAAEARRIGGIARAGGAVGCSVALYNHGSWFGEPDNQIAIIETLRREGVTNVGIVYNLHHGHDHVDQFPALLGRMKPYLRTVNLNGTFHDGEKRGFKIVPLGQGEVDLSLLRTITESGWHGPVGLLNHTDEDAEARLRDNLDGLDWLVAQLSGKKAGPAPAPRTWQKPPVAK